MAKWNEETFQTTLNEELKTFDLTEIESLCDKLIDHLKQRLDPYPVNYAKKILQALRNKRCFTQMCRVADAFLRTELNDPQIRRQYAQALLDQSNVNGALAILRDIIAEENIPKGEYAEAQGLIGRAYKQIYMDANNSNPKHFQEAIRIAIDSYYSVYESDTENYLWHGINAVSLLQRAQKDGLHALINEWPDAQKIADNILSVIEDKDLGGKISMWDLAVAAEANVALSNFQNANNYLQRYVNCDGADAFELTSTLRQFEEVIMLDNDEGEQRYLIDFLRAELLKRPGGTVINTAESVGALADQSHEREENLERLLGPGEIYQTHAWLLKCMRRAQYVGRIWYEERCVGTGFIVPGGLLAVRWEGLQIFVTNNHVIHEKVDNPNAFYPHEVTVTFDLLGPDKFHIEKILAESKYKELDFTCALLNKSIDIKEAFPIAERIPDRKGIDRIYIIGYPLGGPLSYSFQSNWLIDKNLERIHYRSPTQPGNSGSPLFNDRWELIGLHHAGSKYMRRLDKPKKEYAANEGILLPAIKAKLEGSSYLKEVEVSSQVS